MKVVCSNRKASRDYNIEEIYEAGIVLKGTEVKSLRDGKADLTDSYAAVEDGELFLHNVHISPYSKGNIANHDPKRTRKLLMHSHQIKRLFGKTTMKGLTLIPMKIYFSDAGKAKVELGLARGKKLYDKRREIAEKDARREMRRARKEDYY